MAYDNDNIFAKILRGEIPHSIVNKEVLERPEFKQKLARFQSS